MRRTAKVDSTNAGAGYLEKLPSCDPGHVRGFDAPLRRSLNERKRAPGNIAVNRRPCKEQEFAVPSGVAEGHGLSWQLLLDLVMWVSIMRANHQADRARVYEGSHQDSGSSEKHHA